MVEKEGISIACRLAYNQGKDDVINPIQEILDELKKSNRTVFAWGCVQDKLNELKEL